MENNETAHCPEHGDVKPGISYVMNALGDDSSGTIRIVFWKNQTEHLLGMDNSAIVRYKEHPEEFQDMKHKLLGEMVRVVGRVKNNIMFNRLEFNAQLVIKPNPEEELQRLQKVEA
jgi:ssDNA-binding replication factor A large subunit